MKATIGEPPVETIQQFHAQIAEAMSFPHYYGRNLNALWDVLRIDIEKPTQLIWLNSTYSNEAMGADFATIVSLCHELTAEDDKNGWPRFELILK